MRKSESRTISPAKRGVRQAARGRDDGDPPARGPDPADFESGFAVDDDDVTKAGALKSQSNQNGNDKTMQETAPQQVSQEINKSSPPIEDSGALSELPTDVRDKLRKLEKYESRYHGTCRIANRPEPLLTALRAA